MDHTEPIVTELDAVRLARLLGRSPASRGPRSPTCPFPELDDKLEIAQVVSGREVAPDVVTMNSVVRVRELPDGQPHDLTLVYPADATQPGRISVVSPLGRALLGTRAGSQFTLTLPDGTQNTWRVEAVVYQPEAAGHYDV